MCSAVKMKDAGVASEVIAVTIGPKQVIHITSIRAVTDWPAHARSVLALIHCACESLVNCPQAVDTLRTALAMGADRGIHLETSARIDLDIPHLHTAAALAHIATTEKVDLVLAGKQSIDDDSALVPSMIAAMLKRPQAMCASSISRSPPSHLTVAKEVDGGSQTVKVALPAVVSGDLRLNTPRYATLPNIMKAKKKPIAAMQLDAVLKEAGVDSGRQRLRVVEVREPKDRRAGVKVETVDELVAKLRSEARVV